MFAPVLFLAFAIAVKGKSFPEIDESECVVNKSQNVDMSRIHVFYYDTNLKVQGFVDTAAQRIAAYPGIEYSKRLVVFVPGYQSFTGADPERWTMEAFLKDPNTTLIIIDYSFYTKVPLNKNHYLEAVKNSYSIGKAIGDFLSKLHNYGYPSQNIYCFGHSFGGQLVSFISEVYTENTGERLWRITGIDPAGPCFESNSIDNQIRSGTAEYVEVYHCSEYGTSNEIGDVDVFFNPDRDNQPGCDGGNIFADVGRVDAGVCNHIKCVDSWLKSVDCLDCYVGHDSYKGYMKGGKGQAVVGYHNPGDIFGLYYASTKVS